MARIDIDDLQEAEPIFVAAKLGVARQAEECLTRAGVEYAVEVEPIGRTLLFRRVRMGAAFYVSAAVAPHCREQLSLAGLGSGVVEREG